MKTLHRFQNNSLAEKIEESISKNIIEAVFFRLREETHFDVLLPFLQFQYIKKTI